MNILKKIELYLFTPQNKTVFNWIFVGPFFLLFSAAVILLNYSLSYAHVILLLLALCTMASFYKVSAKIGVLLICINFTFAFALFSSVISFLWLISLVLSLIISLYAINEAKIFSVNEAKKIVDLTKEATLWRSRFETIKEKMLDDKKVVEDEIDRINKELHEKNDYILSLRSLIDVLNKELSSSIKQLEELKMETSNVKIAITNRERRNRDLLGTSKSSNSITLKDLNK